MAYIAKPDTWFDVGTDAILIDDYRPQIDSGLFRGIKDGHPDEEVCGFDEFFYVELPSGLLGGWWESSTCTK